MTGVSVKCLMQKESKLRKLHNDTMKKAKTNYRDRKQISCQESEVIGGCDYIRVLRKSGGR